jgi:O-antigen/teichoic acid export membrane protein
VRQPGSGGAEEPADPQVLAGDDALVSGPSDSPGRPFWATRSWWGRAGQTSIAVWGSNALSFFGTVVAARYLGPGDYGSVLIALGVVTLVATFLDLTLEEALVFHGNRALAAGDHAGLRAMITTSFRLDLALGVLVTAGIVAFAQPLADIATANRIDPTLIRLAAFAVFAATVDSTTSAMLLLARQPHLRGWSIFATAVFRLCGIVVAAQIGGVEAFVVAYAVATAAGSAVLGFIAWRTPVRCRARHR